MDYEELMDDIDIVDELSSRGIKGKHTGKNYMICCPYHGESNPSFGINTSHNKRRGLFNCFSCGEKGNFFHLISFLDEISFREALRLFKKGFIDVKKISKIGLRFKEILTESVNKKNTIRILKKEVLLKYKKPYGDYLKYLKEERKFTDETIDKWNILCCDSGPWEGRVLFPIYDKKNRLVSITARKIYEKDKFYKVRKIKDTDVKKVLFGIGFLKPGTNIVLVEGECDCVYLQQNGIPAVGISGSDISETQLNKIVKFTERATICLDGEVPYKNSKGLPSIRKIKDKLSKFIDVDYIKLPHGKDPNDLTVKEVNTYFKKA